MTGRQTIYQGPGGSPVPAMGENEEFYHFRLTFQWLEAVE